LKTDFNVEAKRKIPICSGIQPPRIQSVDRPCPGSANLDDTELQYHYSFGRFHKTAALIKLKNQEHCTISE